MERSGEDMVGGGRMQKGIGGVGGRGWREGAEAIQRAVGSVEGRGGVRKGGVPGLNRLG